ncbi:universal stress protein [Arsenicicoccus piscis]|uniref:Universal stress protein n=1 Tax=Arsenicicoccus piscis TaxID=673954 RepID=A0ABQ6HNE1_9MICO|nr:universal stress protein [Arsenicicoccus piscis]MCH8629022.1 universal stress protein [Arsenicicoccus piscis]GMA19640.1 universal stress protein [Arsenicicoccus piscis]
MTRNNSDGETPGTCQVVVGFDGSDHSYRALDWAADWALERGSSLEVIMAQEVLATAPHELGWGGDIDDLIGKATEDILDHAKARCAERFPSLPVTTRAQWGNPAAALLEASEQAEIVVLGTRGQGGWRGLLLGSVSLAVAAHAQCPVIVVPRPRTEEETAEAAEGTDGAANQLIVDAVLGTDGRRGVVVGVDDSADAARAVEFAYHEAAARGVPLTLLHAWTLDFHGGVVPTEEGSEAFTRMRAKQDALLERALGELGAQGSPAAQGAQGSGRQGQAEVEVRRSIVRGTPGRVLAAASQAAELVVVGSRGRGGFRGMLLGSTSREVMARSACPVGIVRRGSDHKA